DDVEKLIARDRPAIGFDRSMLLNELGKRAGSRIVANGDAVALIRNGLTARHIGPLFARNPDRALALVRNIANEEGGALLLDAIASHHEFLAGLLHDGWSIERPFQRMRFGAIPPPCPPPSPTPPRGRGREGWGKGEGREGAQPPFAVAGPEYG